jgi:hypothetical protein
VELTTNAAIRQRTFDGAKELRRQVIELDREVSMYGALAPSGSSSLADSNAIRHMNAKEKYDFLQGRLLRVRKWKTYVTETLYQHVPESLQLAVESITPASRPAYMNKLVETIDTLTLALDELEDIENELNTMLTRMDRSVSPNVFDLPKYPEEEDNDLKDIPTDFYSSDDRPLRDDN